jgi:hypothetical protein
VRKTSSSNSLALFLDSTMALISKLDICPQAGLLLHAARGVAYLFTVNISAYQKQ